MRKLFLLLICFVLLAFVSSTSGFIFVRGKGPAAGGGNAISFVAHAKSTTTGNSASISIPMPSGTQDGDLMLAIIVSDHTATPWVKPDSGGNGTWTLLSNPSHAGNGMGVGAWYCIADTETGPYVWSSMGEDENAGQILTFEKSSGSWVEPETEDTHWSYNEVNPSATIAVSSVTVLNLDFLVLGFLTDGSSGIDTAPSGYTVTELWTNGGVGMVAYYKEETAGAKTPQLVWDASDENSAYAIRISIGAQ